MIVTRVYNYVLVHIAKTDRRRNLPGTNIEAYDLCIGTPLQDRKYYRKHMDLGIGNQYRPGDFGNRCSARTPVYIQFWVRRQNSVSKNTQVSDFEFCTRC